MPHKATHAPVALHHIVCLCLCPQASENFAHELRQLRLSVRYNPYKEEAMPTNPIRKVRGLVSTKSQGLEKKWARNAALVHGYKQQYLQRDAASQYTGL